MPCRSVTWSNWRAPPTAKVRFATATAAKARMKSAALTLDIGKAGAMLGVVPTLTLTQAVNSTIAWYRAHERGADARQLCLADLDGFAARLNRPVAANLATAL